MRIRIEIKDDIPEDEVIIRCRELNSRIQEIQSVIAEKIANKPGIIFYKNNEEYFFPVSDIMFFETESDTVYAHTAADVYRTDFRLYELLRFLPDRFVRISKSAIVNTEHILSISRNIASSSLICFRGSHKQIYVSRMYYKELKQKLTDRR